MDLAIKFPADSLFSVVLCPPLHDKKVSYTVGVRFPVAYIFMNGERPYALFSRRAVL